MNYLFSKSIQNPRKDVQGYFCVGCSGICMNGCTAGCTSCTGCSGSCKGGCSVSCSTGCGGGLKI